MKAINAPGLRVLLSVPLWVGTRRSIPSTDDIEHPQIVHVTIFDAHGTRGSHWSMAALCFIGFLGYINAEVNAKLNPTKNAHIMVFYSTHLRLLQILVLFFAILCGVIAYAVTRSNETLGWIPLPLMVGYAVGEEVMWLRLERFARGGGA